MHQTAIQIIQTRSRQWWRDWRHQCGDAVERALCLWMLPWLLKQWRRRKLSASWSERNFCWGSFCSTPFWGEAPSRWPNGSLGCFGRIRWEVQESRRARKFVAGRRGAPPLWRWGNRGAILLGVGHWSRLSVGDNVSFITVDAEHHWNCGAAGACSSSWRQDRPAVRMNSDDCLLHAGVVLDCVGRTMLWSMALTVPSRVEDLTGKYEFCTMQKKIEVAEWCATVCDRFAPHAVLYKCKRLLKIIFFFWLKFAPACVLKLAGQRNHSWKKTFPSFVSWEQTYL